MNDVIYNITNINGWKQLGKNDVRKWCRAMWQISSCWCNYQYIYTNLLNLGAGSGLGRLMSEKMALRHGAKIVCVDVNAEGNAETVNNINSKKVENGKQIRTSYQGAGFCV